MCRASSIASPILHSWPSCVPPPCRLPIATSAHVQVDQSSALTFEVIKSSGDTKSLETIVVEQEEKSNQLVASTFDPTLVYGVVAVGSVFAAIGVGACITIMIVNRQKSDKSKVHATSEDEQVTDHMDQNVNSKSLFYKRASSAGHTAFQDRGQITGPIDHKFDMKSLSYARMDAPERVSLNQSHGRISSLKQSRDESIR